MGFVFVMGILFVAAVVGEEASSASSEAIRVDDLASTELKLVFTVRQDALELDHVECAWKPNQCYTDPAVLIGYCLLFSVNVLFSLYNSCLSFDTVIIKYGISIEIV